MPAFLRFLTASAATSADSLAGPLLETWVHANSAAHARWVTRPLGCTSIEPTRRPKTSITRSPATQGGIDGTRPSIRLRDDDDHGN